VPDFDEIWIRSCSWRRKIVMQQHLQVVRDCAWGRYRLFVPGPQAPLKENQHHIMRLIKERLQMRELHCGETLRVGCLLMIVA
jgi:hypothetical protein